MPKVNRQKAGKDYPAEGIKKGELYYSWQFRTGPVHRSATPPRPSQLTGSEKKATALRAYEDLMDAICVAYKPEDVKIAFETAASDAQEAVDMYEESISNLEEAFPGGCPNLDTAQEELEQIESFIADCDRAAIDVEDLDYNDYQVKPEHVAGEGSPVDWDALTPGGQAEMLEAGKAFLDDCDLSF